MDIMIITVKTTGCLDISVPDADAETFMAIHLTIHCTSQCIQIVAWCVEILFAVDHGLQKDLLERGTIALLTLPSNPPRTADITRSDVKLQSLTHRLQEF